MPKESEPILSFKDTLSPEEYIKQRNAFMLGCIKIVGRGDRLPDHVTTAIAEEFELLRTTPSESEVVST